MEIEPRRQVLLDGAHLSPLRVLLAHVVENARQVHEIERLRQHVLRAELDGLDRHGHVGFTRHEHHAAVGRHVTQAAQDLEAIDAWHPNVDDGEVGEVSVQVIERVFAGVPGHSRERLLCCEFREQGEDLRVVVDDEHHGQRGHGDSLILV